MNADRLPSLLVSAAAGLCLLIACTTPRQAIDAQMGGEVILDALEWAEPSIQRDTELLEAEKRIALRSVELARELVLTARK